MPEIKAHMFNDFDFSIFPLKVHFDGSIYNSKVCSECMGSGYSRNRKLSELNTLNTGNVCPKCAGSGRVDKK